MAAAPFLSEQNDPDNYDRPVVNLSPWLDGRAGGGSAAVYHATNLLLHAINTLLVARLLLLLLGSGVGAVVGAAVFAVHPVQVEPVGFVAVRTDLWATCFVLFATLAWLASRREERPPRRALLLAGAASAYAAGCLAKETAAVLPVALAAAGLDRRVTASAGPPR